MVLKEIKCPDQVEADVVDALTVLLIKNPVCFPLHNLPISSFPMYQDNASITAVYEQSSVHLCFPSDYLVLLLLSLLALAEPIFGSHPDTYVSSSPGLASSGIKSPPRFLAKCQQAMVMTARPTPCLFKHCQLGSIPLCQPPVYIYLLLPKHLCFRPSLTLLLAYLKGTWQDRFI